MPDDFTFSQRMLTDLRRMLGRVDERLAAMRDGDPPEIRIRLEDLRDGIARTVRQMEIDWPQRQGRHVTRAASDVP